MVFHDFFGSPKYSPVDRALQLFSIFFTAMYTGSKPGVITVFVGTSLFTFLVILSFMQV